MLEAAQSKLQMLLELQEKLNELKRLQDLRATIPEDEPPVFCGGWAYVESAN